MSFDGSQEDPPFDNDDDDNPPFINISHLDAKDPMLMILQHDPEIVARWSLRDVPENLLSSTRRMRRRTGKSVQYSR
jgi:hypothetical protein